VFGSVARNEQRPDSDIDILVDTDPVIASTMFDYAGLKDHVASLFEGPVDVIDREALRPRIQARATADAIYAFWELGAIAALASAVIAGEAWRSSLV